jgi:Domain of unknown function (DUF222)/HNH endonuclease
MFAMDDKPNWRPRDALPFDERPRLGSDEERPRGPSDPLIAALPTKRIEEEVTTLAAEIYAATCRWLQLVAELDRREAYLEWGCHSTAQWLAWRCSISERAARDHVRVARRLTELPRVRAAFAQGRLSYSKARAISRVAEPGNEAQLVELARNATASQLERVVRGYGRAVRADETGELERRRHVWHSWDDDGTFSLRARLTPEEGALVLRALEAARHELSRSRRENESAQRFDPQGPPRVSNADALVAVADSSLAAAEDRGVRSGGDAHQVVVHVDAGEGSARVDDGPALGPETARRILCDASLVAVAERGGEPLSVGRKTRTVPGAIRRALRARDGGCRFPGCTYRRFTDAHHIRHWSDGGETSAANLVLLCRRHHRLIHEGGFEVARGTAGELVFRRPDGRVVEPCPAAPRSRASALAARNRRRLGGGISAEATAPPFGGDRLDVGIAVEGLWSSAHPRGP